jgi:hypothetical protein
MNKSSVVLLGSVALATATISYYELMPERSRPSTAEPALSQGPSGPDSRPAVTGRMEAERRDSDREENESSRVATNVRGTPAASDIPHARPSARGAAQEPTQVASRTASQIGAGARLPATVPTPVAQPARIFEVPAELQVPAALVETDPALGLSPAQENLKNEIMRQFLQAVTDGGGAAKAAPAVDGATWDGAQAWADARFRKLFGDEAYNRQCLNIARIPLEPAK